MTIVRRIRSGEGAALRAIRLASLLDEPSAFSSTHAEEAAESDQFWAERAEGAAAGDVSAYFFAETEGGELVGMVGAYRPSPTEPTHREIVSMWTAPEARGQGLGRRLVDEAVAWAQSTDAETIGLWVTEGNDAAVRLYERCGFARTGDFEPLPSDPCKNEIRMHLT